jgi:EmrB/QacA subfamily drug resistance transporter
MQTTIEPTAPLPRTGRDDRSRWIALLVLCVGMLMIVLDATVVNVALPAIQRDLGFSQSSLAWVVNAYLIAFGGLLLLAGRLGDLVSRRGVFLAGLGVFTAASLLCGLAQSQQMLIVARFVQGAGGAMTSAVVLGMIVTMFPERREQAKAIGVYSFVASAGGSVGLLAGGVLTQAVNWHWIFFINVPIGVVTALVAPRLLERDRGTGFAGGADVPGGLLVTSALMLGVYTIVKPAAEHGWTAGVTLRLGGLALALLIGFVIREATARNPLVPLRIFRSRNVSGANLIQSLTVAGMFGMFFLGVLYLQQVLGYGALETGLAFLPVTLVIGALSLRYSERLIMRFGARTTLLPGLVLIAAGLALVAQVQADGAYLSGVLPSMLLLGTGVGVSIPALATLAMSGATEADAGLASGLINTTTQVGAALGLAVLATLSATRSGQLLAQGQPTAEALTGGYRMAFVIAAALVVAAIAVALAVLRSEPAEAEAEAEAETGAGPADVADRRVTAETRAEGRELAAGREPVCCKAR